MGAGASGGDAGPSPGESRDFGAWRDTEVGGSCRIEQGLIRARFERGLTVDAWALSIRHGGLGGLSDSGGSLCALKATGPEHCVTMNLGGEHAGSRTREASPSCPWIAQFPKPGVTPGK